MFLFASMWCTMHDSEGVWFGVWAKNRQAHLSIIIDFFFFTRSWYVSTHWSFYSIIWYIVLSISPSPAQKQITLYMMAVSESFIICNLVKHFYWFSFHHFIQVKLSLWQRTCVHNYLFWRGKKCCASCKVSNRC